MKQIGIWVGIVVIFVAGTWGLIALVSNTNSPQIAQVSPPPPLAKNDHVLGVTDKTKVTLIEYADFQCPACAYYSTFVRQLGRDFENNLLIVYRYFPLISIHKNAMSSSLAAFAAGKQNKFWEMSDLLYENQSSWSEEAKTQDIFTGYAKKLNLNIDQFTADFNSEAARKFINDQVNAGLSIGINSTPSFFVNGRKIANPQTYAAFKQLIQNEIDKK